MGNLIFSPFYKMLLRIFTNNCTTEIYPICIICISMLYLHLFIDNELRYRVLLLMSRETHIGHGGHVLSAIDESEIRFLNFKLLQYCKFIKQDVKFSWNQFHTHWLVKFWSVQELSIMAITIVTWYVVHQRKSHGLNSQSRENNLFFKRNFFLKYERMKTIF